MTTQKFTDEMVGHIQTQRSPRKPPGHPGLFCPKCGGKAITATHAGTRRLGGKVRPVAKAICRNPRCRYHWQSTNTAVLAIATPEPIP